METLKHIHTPRERMYQKKVQTLQEQLNFIGANRYEDTACMLRGKAWSGRKHGRIVSLEGTSLGRTWNNTTQRPKHSHGNKFCPAESRPSFGAGCTRCLIIGELQLQPNGLAIWDPFRHNMPLEIPSINHQR